MILATAGSRASFIDGLSTSFRRSVMTVSSRSSLFTRRSWAGVAVSGALGVLLAATAVSPPAVAAASMDRPSAPIACPAVHTLTGIVGEHGTGFTVTTGTRPRPFDVEVLGVLRDGIAPGKDMIVVRVSDLPGQRVVAAGGGIWAGMSGSPVYLHGKLLGSVSYGFTLGASPVGGVTPAADLYKLRSSARSTTTGQKRSVALPEGMRRDIASRTGATVPSAAMHPLRVPMAVSGLPPRGVTTLQHVADRAGLSVLAYPAGRATRPSSSAAMARPQAGGNFAGVVSYGAISLTGVGTTTAVCGDEAVAFGHPFTFLGSTAMGANGANSLAIVRDPTLGSFKFADIGPAYGTLNADRLSGVRAKLNTVPARTPVTTTIRSGGTTHRDRSDVTQQEYLSTVSTLGVSASFQAAFDGIGRNHSKTSWTITGTRAGGKKFTLTRGNRWSTEAALDAFELPFGDPAFEVAEAEDTLLANEFEPVRITKVTYHAAVAPDLAQESLVRRLVAVNGGRLKERDSVTARVGDRIRVRTVLQPYRSTKTHHVDVPLTVPASARRSTLSLNVQGGEEAAAGDFTGGGEALVADCLLQPRGGCARPKAATTGLDA